MRDKSIEKRFKGLCKDYDSSISLFNFALTINFDVKKESKILKVDIDELLKFQAALAESITDTKSKVDSVNEKVIEANNIMNSVVEKVSEIQIAMQNLIDDKRGENQIRIDNIFQESLLPFEEYEEVDHRSENLRKYVHIKTKVDFAFKIVDKKHFYEVKNQVIILKKLKIC